MDAKTVVLSAMLVLTASSSVHAYSPRESSRLPNAGRGCETGSPPSEFMLGERLAEVLMGGGCVFVGKVTSSESRTPRSVNPRSSVSQEVYVAPSAWLHQGSYGELSTVSIDLRTVAAESLLVSPVPYEEVKAANPPSRQVR